MVTDDHYPCLCNVGSSLLGYVIHLRWTGQPEIECELSVPVCLRQNVKNSSQTIVLHLLNNRTSFARAQRCQHLIYLSGSDKYSDSDPKLLLIDDFYMCVYCRQVCLASP